MQHVTLQQATDLLEIMTINQTVDSGFAVAHHGHIEGRATIIICTCRNDGDCYVVQ